MENGLSEPLQSMTVVVMLMNEDAEAEGGRGEANTTPPVIIKSVENLNARGRD